VNNIVLGMSKAGPICKGAFSVCSACDRNHWYCSSWCSGEARRRSLCRASRKYKGTQSGREAQCAAQRKYRASLRRRMGAPLVAAQPDGEASPGDKAAEVTVPVVVARWATASELASTAAGAPLPTDPCLPRQTVDSAGMGTRQIRGGRVLWGDGLFSVSHQSSAFSGTSLSPVPQPMAQEVFRHDKTPSRVCRVCGRLITHIIEGYRFPKRRRPGRKLTYDTSRDQS